MTRLRVPDVIDRAAAVILAIEAAALLGIGVGYAIYTAVGPQVDVPAVVGVAAFALVMAVGLAFVARGFARGARWSRGAALTWQVLQAAAAAVVMGAAPVVAVTILLISAAVAAAAMRASARDARAEAHEG
ncbi:hypothetical protein RN607_11070 [Demequina capsici]|uniref:Uncharacterized protein n=1 Tax=Demequina capsici TaxID=3075620 RepID=A0AA96FC45_9MICO|nr:hypothetical protein [Demequina sp. PMTSA13]WNM26732.1 hypothetical protein RN607_11070 [Demequina sp. PMTSA13]